jgi:hypothetical protein
MKTDNIKGIVLMTRGHILYTYKIRTKIKAVIHTFT